MRPFIYPTPDSITMNEADFKLHLRDFGEANQNKISWKDLLILVPAWAVLLTANFKDVGFINGFELRGLYAALLLLGTLSYFKIIWWNMQYLSVLIFKKIARWVLKKEKDDPLRLSDYYRKYRHLTNPVDKVESIKTVINEFKNGDR